MNATPPAPPDVSNRRQARGAGLVYVQPQQGGYFRKRRGRGFYYITARGRRVRKATLLERIAALAIPPAWESVWICSNPRGHIQATGIDARGRRQYRYHAKWRTVRDATKFDRLRLVAAALPKLRRRTRRELKRSGYPREKILAAVIRLLDRGGLRIGNSEYAEANGSFGLTTLRNRHVRVRGSLLKLRFRGKSGIYQECEIHDERLARIVRHCSELPGQQLFEYRDEAGNTRGIDSGDVNATIQEWTGTSLTAKDFRTWRGTVTFLEALMTASEADQPTLKMLLETVATALGNTPAICRKHYVHPWLIEQYLAGDLMDSLTKQRDLSGPRELTRDEKLLLSLLPGIRKGT